MPGLSCFDAVRSILSVCPSTKILFLSAFIFDRYIEQALSVNARGYVTKSEPPDVIVKAIRTVARGRTFFSQEIETRLVLGNKGLRLMDEYHTPASTLSAREREVLCYIARAMTKRQIAETMFLSVKTVENYCARLMDKLGIHDRVELTRYCLRVGYVSLS